MVQKSSVSLGCVRASGVYNGFSILLSLSALSLFLLSTAKKGASLSWRMKLAVKYPFACAPTPPKLGPGMQCSQNMSPISFFPVPHPWPAQVKKEGVLFYIISLQDSCWAGMAKWAQLSVSWDVVLPIVSWYQTTCFISLGVPRNLHLFLSPFVNIWSISMFSLHVNFNNYNTFPLWCIHIGSEVWDRERWKNNKKEEV